MCEKNNRMLGFTELPEEDGFDLEELFQTPVPPEDKDSTLPTIDFGGEDAEIIPLAASPEESAPPKTPEPEMIPQKEPRQAAPTAKPVKKIQTSKRTDKSAAPAPQAAEDPAKMTGEAAAELRSSNMVDMFSAALQESDAADERRAMQKLRDTPPLFSFAAIEEEITDPEMTFEALRIKMAEDLPELEDRGHVLWRVEYNGITEKIAKPAKETVFAVKRKIEDSKTFADKFKKRKPEDKPPVCVVKPTIEAQKKGVLRPYKGLYETLEDARASRSAICYILSGDGRLYELRRNEIGEFCTPANPIRECEEVRAGFTLALPRIPASLMRETITFFRRLCYENEQEALINLFWDREQAEYLLYVPKQVVTHTSVDADGDQPDEKRWLHVADIHSHNVMPAIFSKRDDRDEQATRLYIVIGRLNCYFPEIRCRICNGGTFQEVPADEIFEDFGLPMPASWMDKVEFGGKERMNHAV